MKIYTVWTRALIWVLALLLAAPAGVFAQGSQAGPTNQAGPTFSPEQLDQMLAPIALYPDSLLAQILIAATYPTQIVEADRWVKEHRGLKGEMLNKALDKMDWDLSVKALVPFPKVLAMMDGHLDWTTRLGEAFLAEQSEVMDHIQVLRKKAYAQGNLKTTSQQKVVVAQQDIEIEPVNPDVVYVPYYNPLVIYGSWWWPGYPPFAFFPYPGPFVTFGLFGFAAAISVGPFWNWGWGYWNWGGRDIDINVYRNININDPRYARDPRFARNRFRTARFSRFADPRRAALRRTGRLGTAGIRAGSRQSAAAVRRQLRQGRTGFSRRGAISGRTARGSAVRSSAARTRSAARGATGSRSFARGRAVNRGLTRNRAVNRGFARSPAVNRGFTRGGAFRGGFSRAPAFRGGAPAFRGGGARFGGGRGGGGRGGGRRR